MITKPTVFILGAGASFHYGYPTGEQLVHSVASLAEKLANYCRFRTQANMQGRALHSVPAFVRSYMDETQGQTGALNGWAEVAGACETLRSRLRVVNPLVIDFFLTWNDSLQELGKLLIAGVLLEAEAKWIGNHRDFLKATPDITFNTTEWYRFIVHKLLYGLKESGDLLSNKVSFVTFNYDTSLERSLHDALSTIDLVEAKDVETFMTQRVIHVYGSVAGTHRFLTPINLVASLQFGKPPLGQDLGFTMFDELIDQWHVASKSLRTIDATKGENAEALLGIRNLITSADVLYILGYSFEPLNSQRIGLDALANSEKKVEVLFTNYGDSNVVNARVSRLIHRNPIALVGSFNGGNRASGVFSTKSVRTVYRAFADDFEAPEGDGVLT